MLWLLDVHEAVIHDVPELHTPGHGEVSPVQVGGEEDEADAVLRMPVEDGASYPHEAVPSLHLVPGVYQYITQTILSFLKDIDKVLLYLNPEPK